MAAGVRDAAPYHANAFAANLLRNAIAKHVDIEAIRSRFSPAPFVSEDRAASIARGRPHQLPTECRRFADDGARWGCYAPLRHSYAYHRGHDQAATASEGTLVHPFAGVQVCAGGKDGSREDLRSHPRAASRAVAERCERVGSGTGDVHHIGKAFAVARAKVDCCL